jgi:hypothetical protein
MPDFFTIWFSMVRHQYEKLIKYFVIHIYNHIWLNLPKGDNHFFNFSYDGHLGYTQKIH